jgi:hypothetical protein
VLEFCSNTLGIGVSMRATLEEIFYTVDVTSSELWKGVGKTLKLKRVDRDMRPIDVERAGGPSYKTVQAIEKGQAGNVESLDKYARALNLAIVDILYGVLASETTALSPEAAHVVRLFAQTTVEGRTAILAMVNALPASPAPIPVVGAGPLKPGRSRVGPAASGRRTARRSGVTFSPE